MIKINDYVICHLKQDDYKDYEFLKFVNNRVGTFVKYDEDNVEPYFIEFDATYDEHLIIYYSNLYAKNKNKVTMKFSLKEILAYSTNIEDLNIIVEQLKYNL